MPPAATACVYTYCPRLPRLLTGQRSVRLATSAASKTPAFSDLPRALCRYCPQSPPPAGPASIGPASGGVPPSLPPAGGATVTRDTLGPLEPPPHANAQSTMLNSAERPTPPPHREAGEGGRGPEPPQGRRPAVQRA